MFFEWDRIQLLMNMQAFHLPKSGQMKPKRKFLVKVKVLNSWQKCIFSDSGIHAPKSYANDWSSPICLETELKVECP